MNLLAGGLYTLQATPVYHGRHLGKRQDFIDALAQGDDDIHSFLRTPHSGDSMEVQSPVGKFPAVYCGTRCTKVDQLDVHRKHSRSSSEQKVIIILLFLVLRYLPRDFNGLIV